MRKKRSLGILLSILMIFSVFAMAFPATAFAEEASENETVVSEYSSPQEVTASDTKDANTGSTVSKQENQNTEKETLTADNPVAPEDGQKQAPSAAAQGNSDEQQEKDILETNSDVAESGVDDSTESSTNLTDTAEGYPAFDWSGEVAGKTVTIHAPEGALPKDTKVEVKVVDADQILDALRKAASDQELTADEVLAYDFNFYTDEDNQKIEPKSDISVSIEVPDLNEEEEVSAFHLNDIGSDAEKEKVETDYETKVVTLTSSQFSIQALVIPKAPALTSVIYLNGQSGDDSKDGTIAENAVKTFAKAKELATENQDITTIYITGTVDVSGEVTLKGTNAVVKREASFTGYLMRIGSTTTATFSDITIDGNSEEATGTTKSLIDSSGVLNIQDGTVLQNNVLTDLGYFQAEGGAIHTDRGNGSSVINMTGGMIRNNKANYGGGIFLNYSTMNFSGGSIQNNAAIDGTSPAEQGHAAGGGITVYDGSTLNLSGSAEIKNNTSENMGGGISIGTGVGSNGADVLNMTGGTISGNSAGSGGGGVFVQAGYIDKYGTANISGGMISDNRMTGEGTGNNAFGGGGIYVNGYSSWISGFHNGVLNLTNAVIKENTASMQGGGYASCPNSETHIYVKNGVALYANEAESADEIYILASNAYGAHSGNPIYSIAPSMLGGTPYNWKYEDGSEVPLNKLDGQLLAINNESLSLHTDVASDSNAESLAKVVISGNTSATRGAGIGSNGTVNMGESEVTTVDVKKSWDDNNNASRPDSIQVELYRTVEGSASDPAYIGYETLSPDSDGNWEMTFGNLPKNDSDGNPYTYSVKERKVDGYTSEVSGDQDNGYTITNKQTTSISGTKTWEDDNDRDKVRPDHVTVNLWADGTKIQSKTVTADSGWKYSFDDLPVYQDGRKISYTITEDTIAGYNTEIEGYDVINLHTPEKTSVTVTKSWQDDENHEGKRPDSVKVQLYANGVPSGEPVSLSESNQWTYTWKNLNAKKSGTEIKYMVDETGEPDGYTKSITGDAATGYTITNTITGKVSIPVTKIWSGGSGDKAVVHLFADGTEIAEQKLNASNGWKYTFENLDQYKDGKKITYSLTEDSVSGFKTTITYSDEKGFTVTNTKETPKTSDKGTPTSSLKPTSNPQTGDYSHINLWLSILLLSGGILMGNLVRIRKRK